MDDDRLVLLGVPVLVVPPGGWGGFPEVLHWGVPALAFVFDDKSHRVVECSGYT